jgi:uncharacterized protein
MPDGKILVNLTRGRVVCEEVTIADKARRRMRGLLGRPSLPSGEGMLLQPAPSIHTAFMRFAIDVVFMDGTLRVKKIIEELRPWRMASAHHAWAALELAAGEANRRGIAVGDQLGVVEVTDRLGAVMTAMELVGGPGAAAPSDASREHPNGGTVAVRSQGSSTDTEGQGVTATRVLLVGSDRRFRCVAAALLMQRGCAVTLGERTGNVAAVAKREAADVIVLDTGPSLTAAARGVAQLETLDPAVGVVVVGEEAEQALSAMPVLPKWGSFDALYEAIEQARPSRNGRIGHGRSA